MTLLSYIFIFRKQFCFVVSGLKIMGHGNPDNNLELPCILNQFDPVQIHSRFH
jgi:hypothetical protein